jgi:hypothetical protein
LFGLSLQGKSAGGLYYSFSWEGGLSFCWKNHANKSVKDWTTQTETFQLERELEKCWNYYLCTCICLFCCFIYLVSLPFCSILSRGWRRRTRIVWAHGSRMQFDFQRKWNCLETCELWWMHLLWGFSKDRKVGCVCLCVCGVSKSRDTQHAYVFSQWEHGKNVCVSSQSVATVWHRFTHVVTVVFSLFFFKNISALFPSISFHSLYLSVLCVSLRVYIACKRRENVRLQSRSETALSEGKKKNPFHCAQCPILQREGKLFSFFLTDSLCSNTVNPTLYSLLSSSFDTDSMIFLFFYVWISSFETRLLPYPIL